MRASRSRSKYWLKALAEPAVSMIAASTVASRAGSLRSEPSTTSAAAAVTSTSATMRGFVSSMKSDTGELMARDQKRPEEDQCGSEVRHAHEEGQPQNDIANSQEELQHEKRRGQPKRPAGAGRKGRPERGHDEPPEDERDGVGAEAVRVVDADQTLHPREERAVARREVGTGERRP